MTCEACEAVLIQLENPTSKRMDLSREVSKNYLILRGRRHVHIIEPGSQIRACDLRTHKAARERVSQVLRKFIRDFDQTPEQ